MSYDIRIRQADGNEVEITTKPKKFELSRQDEGQLELHVAWCKRDLAEDPEAASAVLYAWPGEDSLVLYRRDDPAPEPEPVFVALISAVGYNEEVIFLKGLGPVPDPLDLSVTQDTTDPNRLTVSIVVNNDDQGEVSLDFGDGSPNETNPGDGTTVTTHVYTSPGNYTVTATDPDTPERTTTESVSVPFPSDDLELSVTADPEDPTRRTASILSDNKGAGQVVILFGDGTGSGINPGDGTTVTTHVYTPGTYTVRSTDTDQPGRTITQEIVIPFPA